MSLYVDRVMRLKRSRRHGCDNHAALKNHRARWTHPSDSSLGGLVIEKEGKKEEKRKEESHECDPCRFEVSRICREHRNPVDFELMTAEVPFPSNSRLTFNAASSRARAIPRRDPASPLPVSGAFLLREDQFPGWSRHPRSREESPANETSARFPQSGPF